MTPFESKLARIESGAKPRVLELCSGAGGMSLGFSLAGFELTAHVESSPQAVETYTRNLAQDSSQAPVGALDMTKVTPAEIESLFSLPTSFPDAFDVVVAGLPCQAFARVGRSKLRSLAEGGGFAHTTDPRGQLYRQFLRIVAESMPVVVVVENVPDILNYGGVNVPEQISGELEALGYTSKYTLMNAAHYGVPQYRERLILVAYRRELSAVPRFASPTHFVDMRRGHADLRKAAMNLAKGARYFVQPLEGGSDLPDAVSTFDALNDLPSISTHLDIVPSRLEMAHTLPYASSPQTPYSVTMRASATGVMSQVDAHSIRLTPRDFGTFALMPEGAEYPEAKRIASQRHQAATINLAADEADTLINHFVPPYDDQKFANKWWKLVRSEPSRTLTAHLGRDTYSHIHYDSSQARMISVREAARLQSFPDWFAFPVSMNQAFQQIGNAVPPMLAQWVATAIKSDLENALSLRRAA